MTDNRYIVLNIQQPQLRFNSTSIPDSIDNISIKQFSSDKLSPSNVQPTVERIRPQPTPTQNICDDESSIYIHIIQYIHYNKSNTRTPSPSQEVKIINTKYQFGSHTKRENSEQFNLPNDRFDDFTEFHEHANH